jgi:hypothetical protein
MMILGVLLCLSAACGAADQMPGLEDHGNEVTPATVDCSGPGAFPTVEAELVWPTLTEVRPSRAAPGEEVEVQGVGGYLHWDNECGQQWLESARDFQLLYEGRAAGSIQCYANTCIGTLIIPATSPAGTHAISVEGGSSLDIEVVK